MAEELKSIETLKSDFISNVSHEFKTPLSIIQTYTKAISKPTLAEEAKKRYIEVIDNNVKKLTNLTQNILSLSKLENQRIEIEKSSFWLDEEIRQCILLLEPKWKSKNLSFNINLDQVKYFGARDLISQVWQNLLDNAIKFSNPGGQISVSLKTQNNQIVAIVADSGVGIPADNLPRIFDKFYQADTSRSSSGNGLGLALVKRIVESLEGTISVSSEENKGTTFRIEFKPDSR
jgi:signal transduction histidine kinase